MAEKKKKGQDDTYGVLMVKPRAVVTTAAKAAARVMSFMAMSERVHARFRLVFREQSCGGEDG